MATTLRFRSGSCRFWPGQRPWLPFRGPVSLSLKGFDPSDIGLRLAFSLKGFDSLSLFFDEVLILKALSSRWSGSFHSEMETSIPGLLKKEDGRRRKRRELGVTGEADIIASDDDDLGPVLPDGKMDFILDNGMGLRRIDPDESGYNRLFLSS